ncbi:D-alanyl-lipoteichoic acid acyltransferase DltB, MBOAT superfamily [Pseudobutyrivibrio sp. YE44]|uniref:MBOAT family O-acyltransferase n=1 Tax=Pseudobutyrivibrio sp. YE44 TaxID=1520802 RepID=UPI00089163C0|nr:MBOAT family O-acyltransferase [Pseudobutyrivibrio sp. YE44]SDB38494.1 D-alanyl-lipoteichoic acid acyltransferase DltB, MBOAT superfamily [Pseudobutyrivibrio sp. YE44]
MSFTTLKFIIFFGIVFCCYFTFPKKYQRYILLVASYVFYAFTSVQAFLMLIAITLITYVGGLRIGKINDLESEYLKANTLEKDEKKKYKALQQKKRKRVITLVILLLLAILGFFKYSKFIFADVQWVLNLLNMGVHFKYESILLPAGLSFYIFQSMGYTIDVYRGMVEAEHDLSKYALYVAYFPHIMQGPLGDYSRLSPQLYGQHDFDRRSAVFGLQRVAWGFFKKLVIANSLQIAVDRAFNAYYTYEGIVWILVLFFYSIQMYADFSGYMDIANGCSQMMGITLDENFSTPYFSKNIAEYWRRWHISLGAWFRNYVFYSLLRSPWLDGIRKKYKKQKKTYLSQTLPNVFALLITWLCIGMWHGAAWTYIAHGMFHGFFVIMDSAMSPVVTKWRKNHAKISDSVWFNGFRIVRTFIIVNIGYAMFRAQSLEVTGYVLKSIFSGVHKSVLGAFLFNHYYYIISAFIGGIVLLLVDIYHEKHLELGGLRTVISQKSAPVRYAIYIMGIVAIIFLGTYGDASLNSFAYFQF